MIQGTESRSSRLAWWAGATQLLTSIRSRRSIAPYEAGYVIEGRAQSAAQFVITITCSNRP